MLLPSVPFVGIVHIPNTSLNKTMKSTTPWLQPIPIQWR